MQNVVFIVAVVLATLFVIALVAGRIDLGI